MPGHRKRRQFKQTDAFTRGMVIGLKRAGWSIRQIAADTHLGASTVHRLWRRWLEQGNVAIYRNAGATRVTSARVDRRILRQAVAAPQATCTAILQHVQDTLDHSISTRTISRRLVANGLHSCRPLRRLPLTPPNRRQHESRFCLSSDSRRVRVWRRRGERSNPAAIVERPTVRQRGIMVWGAIAYDSRSPLLRIQGTMTAQRYVDDVLRPVTLPYLQGVPNALYQQDNARPHTARISQQALQDVQMLPWPSYSPDLSPIEHVWDIIGRRLHALPQPRSEDELWQMVEREWRVIPQDAIRTLIDSLPRRVAACIAVRVIKCFESHFMPRRNIIYERARFNQRCQQEGERVNDFITALHSLAEHCNFGALYDELIRDRIVVGVRDRALSERMQLDTYLTLVKATQMAKQLESVKEQQSSLYQQNFVDQIKKMPNHIKESKKQESEIRQFKSNQSGRSSRGCIRCGNANSHDWKNCPAMNSYCNKCKRKGHYAKVCRSVAINEVKSEITFLGSVGIESSKKWVVPIKQLSPKHEALKPSEFPIRPWQKVGMDLFYLNGRWHLIVCDYYSSRLKSIFARHGTPETVRSDNGPQFQKVLGSEFGSRFSKEWSFKHITSSPRFPQSNGFVEAIIKNIKQSLKKEEDCYLTLQAYRTMPLENGYSPAELLMGRRLRTSGPRFPL
ncbi:hypothetical protein LAZ67_4003775 [Cordylochernes scorpioides]|uniref:Integrase catalytic domain-containing protein n=1 Tax=Cordylochernes scorpioides TaxID=51811 RepID=A0ABY6KDZ1_9ARAC|nr:hypothetical protein LAZ67_4003775 [Cordylochernes scorpioides]